MTKKNFYLTTTLPYVNADPHIGFALELVQADAIVRYQKMIGAQTLFNTGTDEHGLKIQQKAEEKKISPQQFVDQFAPRFRDLGSLLGVEFDRFIRTTDPKHISAAQEFWQRCAKNGDIYKAKQKVFYCVGCEMEKTSSELVDNQCPLHPTRQIETLEEENYFFRFSKYQKKLLTYYESNPDFVLPDARFKEIKAFVKKGLKDFSVSRLKEKLPWGIPVPNDPDHVMYVWFDALVNYISTLDWPKETEFEEWWPGVQIAGKDNLRQQTAMWQAMLMSAGLPPSRQVLIHGFITSKGKKMSKSLGNVVNPYDLVEKYGRQAVRYYLLAEIPTFKDGDFTTHRFEQLYNADLANGLGNLVQRVSVLASRAQMKGFPPQTKLEPKFKKLMAEYQFNLSLNLIRDWMTELDGLINQAKPWEKKGKELIETLAPLISAPDQPSLLKIALHLKPFLPTTSEVIEKIFTQSLILPPKRPLFPRL